MADLEEAVVAWIGAGKALVDVAGEGARGRGRMERSERQKGSGPR